VPTTGPIPTAPNNQYVSNLEQGAGPYSFDINRAKSLLTSHGWTQTNGVMTCTRPGSGANQCGVGVPAGQALHLTLEYANGVKSVDQIVQQWKSDASQAGIDIAINAQPFNTVISDTTSCGQKPSTCNWQLALFGYQTYFAVPSGDGLFLPGSAVNYGGINDPTLTNLVNKTLHDSSITTFHDYVDYAARTLPGAVKHPGQLLRLRLLAQHGRGLPVQPARRDHARELVLHQVTGYLIRRVLQSLVVIILVSLVTFALLHLLPGGPARAILGPRANAAQLQQFTIQNHYDRPLIVQVRPVVQRSAARQPRLLLPPQRERHLADRRQAAQDTGPDGTVPSWSHSSSRSRWASTRPASATPWATTC